MSRIVVIGASRGIGLEVTRLALKSGHSVRAFARSANDIRMSHKSLEKFTGDALNSEDLLDALSNMDAVVVTLGVNIGPSLFFGPIDLFSKATEKVIDCMKILGIKRLLCVTGFGAGDSREAIGCLEKIPFHLLLAHAYSDKGLQERLIVDSDLDWTIVRPGILTNGPRKGRYKILDNPTEWRNGIIGRADVADFIVKAFADGSYRKRAPVLVY